MEKDLKEYITPPIMLIVVLLAISLMFIFPVLNMIILGAILAYGIRPIAFRIQSKIQFDGYFGRKRRYVQAFFRQRSGYGLV